MSFNQFKKLAENKIKLGCFMLVKLPSAWLCGIRLRKLDEQQAEVTVPFKWLSQNPFRSIYFACQAMAAEMSTGMLAMGHLYKKDPPVSMLVTKMECVFIKKANERIYFNCNDGIAIKNCIEKAMETGEGQSVIASSIGVNKKDEVVSSFKIEWSFKVKSK